MASVKTSALLTSRAEGPMAFNVGMTRAYMDPWIFPTLTKTEGQVLTFTPTCHIGQNAWHGTRLSALACHVLT